MRNSFLESDEVFIEVQNSAVFYFLNEKGISHVLFFIFQFSLVFYSTTPFVISITFWFTLKNVFIEFFLIFLL